MALSDKNIIITPNIGSASDPKIQFSGADASTGAQTITLNVYPTSGGMLSFEGSSGQLFSITNSLSGTIYSVNDISGIPSIEVLDSGLIKLAQYSGNVAIGSSSSNNFKVNLYGPDYYQLRLAAPTAPLLKFSGSYNSGNGAEIWQNSSGTLYFNVNGNQTAASMFAGPYTEIYGSTRSPIYYDYNDTGYYADPASTSILNTIGFNGTSANAFGSYWAGTGGYPGYQYAGGNSRFGFSSTGGYVDVYTDGYFYCGIDPTGANRLVLFEDTWLNSKYFGSDGNTYAQASMRAPIFYDYNDTGYYIDPNSTGATALRMRGGALFGPNPTWGRYLYIGGNGDYDSAEAQIFTTNGNLHLEPKAGNAIYLDNYRGGWFRANGWYDTNDTGYYIDINSTSRMNRIDTDEFYNYGWFRNYYTNKGLYNQANGVHFYSNGGASWAITGSGGNVELQFRSNHESTMRGYVYANTGGSIGFLDYNGNWRIRGDGANVELYGGTYVDTEYAYVWYDRNDTAYYLDPNSNSNMYKVTAYQGAKYNTGDWADGFRNTPTSGRTFHGDISSGGPQGSWWFYDSMRHSNGSNYWGTQIAYGWEDNANELWQRNITANSFSGWVRYLNTNNYSGYAVKINDWHGNLYHHTDGRIYATIFYDANDSGYYLDPNSYSYVSSLRAAAYLASSGNVYIDNNYGYGVVGVYSSYRYQGVFAMGDSYKLAADGTTTGSLYGIAWSHPNAGGVASNLNTHGALIMENGGFLAALSGSIRSRDDMRTPIFYDSNNTGYYLDPNSSGTSLNVAGAITAAGNVTAYSDVRVKYDIQPITDAVAKVKQLNGVTFMRTDVEDARQTGVIAQDVLKVLPEAVRGSEAEHYSVAYGNMVGLLIEAIKEQQVEITELKSLVKQLLAN